MGFLRRVHSVTPGPYPPWGAGVPGPLFKVHPFHVLLPGCCIHPTLYLKNVPYCDFWPPCCEILVTGLRDTSRQICSCEICKNLNVEPLLRLERSQVRGTSCWLHPQESGLACPGLSVDPAKLLEVITGNSEVF